MNKIAFQHQDTIWKLVPHHSDKLLAMECRDAAKRETYFCTFDLTTAKLVSPKLYLNEKWWITLQAYLGSFLVISYYDNVQYANMKGFTLLNVDTGKVTWFKKEIQFLNGDAQYILGFDTKLNKEEIFDIKTGNEVNISKLSIKSPKKIIYPDLYLESQDSFVKISFFIKRKKNIDVFGRIEYSEYQNYIVIVYYTGQTNDWSKHILILDIQGKIHYDTIVANNLKGWSDYSFFIFHQKLILLKNEQTIEILDL